MTNSGDRPGRVHRQRRHVLPTTVRWNIRDGTTEFKLAPVRKSIYSLPVLRELLGRRPFRSLDFLAAIEEPCRRHPRLGEDRHAGARGRAELSRLQPVPRADLDLFRTSSAASSPSAGSRLASIAQHRQHLADCSGAHLSRLLKRLRTHGLIKKIGKRYKYYLTTLGRTVATAALKLRELVIILLLNHPVPA